MPSTQGLPMLALTRFNACSFTARRLPPSTVRRWPGLIASQSFRPVARAPWPAGTGPPGRRSRRNVAAPCAGGGASGQIHCIGPPKTWGFTFESGGQSPINRSSHSGHVAMSIKGGDFILARLESARPRVNGRRNRKMWTPVGLHRLCFQQVVMFLELHASLFW